MGEAAVWVPCFRRCQQQSIPVQMPGWPGHKVPTMDAILTRAQVYCGWGSSQCVLRAGRKVYLPPDTSAARAGGNGSIQ